MRTFAQKHKPTQGDKSASSARTARVFYGQSREVRSILHSQRTIGHQEVRRLPQSQLSSTGFLQRKCSRDSNAGSSPNGECEECRRERVEGGLPSLVQLKLRIGAPGDKYEQKADRIAAAVMRMPESKVQSEAVPEEETKTLIQSKSLAEKFKPIIQREVESEEDEEGLQTKELPGRTPVVGAAAGSHCRDRSAPCSSHGLALISAPFAFIGATRPLR